jgi:hypothetical protein
MVSHQQRVDLRLSELKPLVPMFMEASWDNLARQLRLVTAAWDRAVSMGAVGRAAMLGDAGKLFPAADMDEPVEAELELLEPTSKTTMGTRAVATLARAIVVVQVEPATEGRIQPTPTDPTLAERIDATSIRAAAVTLPPAQGRAKRKALGAKRKALGLTQGRRVRHSGAAGWRSRDGAAGTAQ